MKSYANPMKQNFISGTLLLTLTGILSRIIGFYYKIFLSRRIGAEGLGIYQLIFPVFALIISVSAAGIQTAISRYCAQCRQKRQARAYLSVGLSGSLLLSASCVWIIWHYAPQIGLSLLEDVRTVPLLRIMTLSLPFACIHACINGYYYGRKKAVIPAISQILEQVIRVAGVWLVADIQMQRGQLVTPQIAVWGILFGELASSLYSVTMVCFFSERTENKKTVPNPSVPPSSIRLTKIAKDLCSMAVPLTCSRILLSLCQSAEALLIPIKLRDFGYANSDALSVYGILTGMVFSTIMFPCVLSNSLSVMLLPAIAEANSRKQYNPGAKSHPENHTAVCHSRSCVYLRISAVRKLDRHPSVSQHTGRYLCAHPELDLSVFIPRKHTVQHFARAWQGYPHHADQPGWCRHPHYICFRRNPPHWTECLPLGHAGQSDPDLCARIFLSASCT